MEKMILIRSLTRSIFRRSQPFSSAAAAAAAAVSRQTRHLHFSSPSLPASSPNQNQPPPLAMRLGSTRSFSEDVSHMPVISDPEIERSLNDLMGANWDHLPPAVVKDAKNAVAKSTDDKAGQDALKNVFRAAEAVEEFTGMVIQLKMELDDSIGLSGENVKPLPEGHVQALEVIFSRYAAYLDAFGPEETYLKKKVEMELGTKLIYLKMRCAGLRSDWGKVTVLGTSGLSGSYIEKRA